MTWITNHSSGRCAVSSGRVACEKFHKLLAFAPDEALSEGQGMTEPSPSGSPPGSRNASKPPSGAEFAGAGLQLALSLLAFMCLGIWLE